MQSTTATKRAAVYPRVSSKHQEDNYSIGTQLAACLSHAERLGYSVDERHVYREIHTGVDFWERPEMTRLRESIRASELDAVIFYSVDRYARDPVFHMLGLAEARQYGVTFHIVTEDLDLSDDDDVLMFFLRGYSAKREWRDLRERSTRGRRARANEGKLISRPKPLYGYRFADEERSRYTVYEPEARIVRRIVDACLSGQAINRVRLDLNADGIPSPSGKSHWSHTTVHRILTTRDYTGQGAGWRGEFALPAGVIPPIVTDEEHEEIRERLRHNKQFSARNTIAPDAALLRGGFVRCGYCGRVAHTVTAHEGLVYRCYGHPDQPDGCPGARIPVARLDALIWSQVYAALTQEDVIERALRRMLDDDPTGADLTAVDRMIHQIERKQANLTTAIGMVQNPDAIALLAVDLEQCAEQLGTLGRERETLTRRRAQWERALNRLHELRRWAQTVESRLEGFDWEQKRVALAAVAAQVKLFRPDHEPPYKLRMILPFEDDEESVSLTTCPGATRSGARGC